MSFNQRQILDILSNHVVHVKMFPYFDICHYILCCMYVRNDFKQTNDARAMHSPFSRRHPLSCWLACIISIFAGSLLSRFLLNEPIAGAFKDNQQILIATLVWYLVFYSPADIFYKMCNLAPIRLTINILKEFHRCHKIKHGVFHAARVFPTSYFVMVLIGTINGNGSGFIRILERLCRGIWSPMENEFKRPTFATKASILASIVFVIEKTTRLISFPHVIVYTIILSIFIAYKIAHIVHGVDDRVGPLENLLCYVFFGGFSSDMSRPPEPNPDTGSVSGNSEKQKVSGDQDRTEKKQNTGTRKSKTSKVQSKQD